MWMFLTTSKIININTGATMEKSSTTVIRHTLGATNNDLTFTSQAIRDFQWTRLIARLRVLSIPDVAQ